MTTVNFYNEVPCGPNVRVEIAGLSYGANMYDKFEVVVSTFGVSQSKTYSWTSGNTANNTSIYIPKWELDPNATSLKYQVFATYKGIRYDQGTYMYDFESKASCAPFWELQNYNMCGGTFTISVKQLSSAANTYLRFEVDGVDDKGVTRTRSWTSSSSTTSTGVNLIVEGTFPVGSESYRVYAIPQNGQRYEIQPKAGIATGVAWDRNSC